MEKVYENLFVGAESGCTSVRGDSDWAVVHACKHPCHNRVCGNPSQGHPNYLEYRDGSDLYLNMVDMDRKQEHRFMQPMINATLDFVDDHIDSNRVLIHCNQGLSRSPSLALLYLAKRTDVVPDEGLEEALQAFRDRYPRADPSRGIYLYLQDYWHQLD